MKLYKVEFNKYSNRIYYNVYSEKYDKYLTTNNRHIIISENDIDYFKSFGDGIYRMEYVGDLFKREDVYLEKQSSCKNCKGE